MLPEDALDPPAMPRILVYLAPETFNNGSVRHGVQQAINAFGGPLERLNPDLQFIVQEHRESDFVFVAVERIYGLGPKREKDLRNKICAAVRYAMRPAVEQAEMTTARVSTKLVAKKTP
jgi:hypothetical protein